MSSLKTLNLQRPHFLHRNLIPHPNLMMLTKNPHTIPPYPHFISDLCYPVLFSTRLRSQISIRLECSSVSSGHRPYYDNRFCRKMPKKDGRHRCNVVKFGDKTYLLPYVQRNVFRKTGMIRASVDKIRLMDNMIIWRMVKIGYGRGTLRNVSGLVQYGNFSDLSYDI